mgnify:CR=1 FL=1
MNKNFPFVFWMLTVLIGPLFLIGYEIVIEGLAAFGMLQTLPVLYVLGSLYSLPTLFACLILFKLFRKLSISNFYTRTLITFLGILGVMITFYFIKGTLTFQLSISYSAAAILSGSISQLKMTKE